MIPVLQNKEIEKMDGIDKVFLSEVVAATAAGTLIYVGQVQGQPLVAAGLIEVNSGITDPSDPTKVACRSTAKANDYLSANQAPAGNGEASKYTIITGAVLPAAKKRGNTSGSGAPTKYPFADLPVGGTFFSPNSDHTKGDAVKGLGSTVSAQNDKYSEQKVENGQPVFKTVTRAVRDKATKKAQIGPDGKKVTETVQLPVKEYTRKFTIRPVVGGKAYGDWVAPADGALVGRTV